MQSDLNRLSGRVHDQGSGGTHRARVNCDPEPPSDRRAHPSARKRSLLSRIPLRGRPAASSGRRRDRPGGPAGRAAGGTHVGFRGRNRPPKTGPRGCGDPSGPVEGRRRNPVSSLDGVLDHGARRGVRGMVAGAEVRSCDCPPSREAGVHRGTPAPGALTRLGWAMDVTVDGAHALRDVAFETSIRRALREERAVRLSRVAPWRLTRGAGSASDRIPGTGAGRIAAVRAGGAMPSAGIADMPRPPRPRGSTLESAA